MGDLSLILNPISPCPEPLRPPGGPPSAHRAKDAADFSKKCLPNGPVNFPPFEEDFDASTLARIEQFKVEPLGQIRHYCRHIPYSSNKKDFFEKTGRSGFDLFQYVFQYPPDNPTKRVVLWDYYNGLVRMTPFFKCLGYPKTQAGKMLNQNAGMKEISHSITGGAIAAQGYWIPYRCAKAVCAKFCYPIAGALIPLFGPDFPALCLPTTERENIRMQIDPTIVTQDSARAEDYRRRQLDGAPQRVGRDTPARIQPNFTSPTQQQHAGPSHSSTQYLQRPHSRDDQDVRQPFQRLHAISTQPAPIRSTMPPSPSFTDNMSWEAANRPPPRHEYGPPCLSAVPQQLLTPCASSSGYPVDPYGRSHSGSPLSQASFSPNPPRASYQHPPIPLPLPRNDRYTPQRPKTSDFEHFGDRTDRQLGRILPDPQRFRGSRFHDSDVGPPPALPHPTQSRSTYSFSSRTKEAATTSPGAADPRLSFSPLSLPPQEKRLSSSERGNMENSYSVTRRTSTNISRKSPQHTDFPPPAHPPSPEDYTLPPLRAIATAAMTRTRTIAESYEPRQTRRRGGVQGGGEGGGGSGSGEGEYDRDAALALMDLHESRDNKYNTTSPRAQMVAEHKRKRDHHNNDSDGDDDGDGDDNKSDLYEGDTEGDYQDEDDNGDDDEKNKEPRRRQATRNTAPADKASRRRNMMMSRRDGGSARRRG